MKAVETPLASESKEIDPLADLGIDVDAELELGDSLDSADGVQADHEQTAHNRNESTIRIN